MAQIEVKIGYDTIKVYFGEVLHLRLARSKLLGIQSWRLGTNRYFIEFTMADGVVTSDYDDADKWKTILSELDKAL